MKRNTPLDLVWGPIEGLAQAETAEQRHWNSDIPMFGGWIPVFVCRSPPVNGGFSLFSGFAA